MKRLKDDERIIGPLFPRLHVNDTEKGGPKAPPRNKMAIYEQLSVPSQRFNHAPNNSLANLRSLSTQGSGDQRGMFFSHQQPSKQLPEKQYSDLSTQVDQRKKSDEDDFTVPIFTQSVRNQESGKHCNGTEREIISSYLNHTLKFQKTKKTSIVERNMRQQGKIQNEANMAALNKRYSSRLTVFASEDVHDLSNNTESIEEGSMQTKNLERGDSVTSVLDCVSGLDITPDDVVGIIGQKRFWKARRTIAHQQRVFAVQVFELHRLIKVQKLIAASPHLLLENSSSLTEPINPLPRKKSRKIDPEEPSHKPKISSENTLKKKSSFSSIQNDNQNGGPWCFNQPHGPHWLIPVMSPSEGLIYKPYPGPTFFAPAPQGGGPQGSNPTVNNFPIPACGVLAPHQFPSFPLAGPPGYPLGMPVMNPAPFLVEQMNGPDFLDEIEDTGLQASTASSNAHKPEHERPTAVIKVVPHNAKTATESAARIFRAIQEERKRYNAP